MRDRPRGDELLASARKLLRDGVLPVLAKEYKHSLLMVMNAMSIAERQLRFGESPLRDEAASLSKLVGEDGEPNAARRRLSLAIRVGAGDPGQPQRNAIFAYLRKTGRQRLMESNPKALADTNAEAN